MSFDGPLVAFDPGPEAGAGVSLCLGGDLHQAPGRRPGQRRDESLEEGRIVLVHGRERKLETMALEGVWCLAIDAELADSAPCFILRDAEGRLRTWLLLPRPGR